MKSRLVPMTERGKNRFREYKRKACDNKVWFPTRKRARKGAKYYRGIYGIQYGIYKCEFCAGYHLTREVDWEKNEKIEIRDRDIYRREENRKLSLQRQIRDLERKRKENQ